MPSIIVDQARLILFLNMFLLIEAQKQYFLDDRVRNDQHNCGYNHTLRGYLSLLKPNVLDIMHEVRSGLGSRDYYEMYSTFIDKFGPRPSGSETLEKAIDYMKDLTNKNGVFDVHTEDVMVPEWKRGLESLKMLRPRLKQLSILGIGLSVPTDGKITAEVIVVSSFEELESIDNAIIKGKIILFNTNFTTYENTIQYRRNSAVKAARKGAVAVLVRSITPISLYTTHTGDLVYEPHVKKIPAAAITIEDADFLQRIHNRGEVIVIEIQMSNELKANISRNLIIDVKGYDIPDKMVIVSGHIDSWDVGQGAIDDGGGMMISWFVPVVLNYLKLKPRRTLRAILWTSEEVGLNGAKAYLERHSDELDNIDFIMESDEGTFKPLGLEVAGSKNVTCLINEILQLFKPWDLNRLKVANSTGSDISIFIDKGIPGASLLNKDDRYFWYHHSNADTLTAQNKSDVLDCAAFWAAISYLIAELPVDIRRS